MPELPEVESIVRSLREPLLGCTLDKVKIIDRGVLRNTSAREFGSVRGSRVVGLNRRGKFLLLHLSNGLVILFHLKMTGRLLMDGGDRASGTYLRLRIELRESDETLLFEDMRKFGYVALLSGKKEAPVPLLDELGPDALSISREGLRELLARSARPVKALLLDQRRLAGMGNIYSDECLYRAGIHPLCSADRISSKKVKELHTALRSVLRQAIKHGGSSVRDFRNGQNRAGKYQRFHKIYGKRGEACPRCGSLIEYTRVASRGTHFCPDCQKKPRVTREKASRP